MKRINTLSMVAALFVAGVPAGAGVAAHEVSAQVAKVTSYVDAYNAKDADAMRALMHPDIQWIAIEGAKSEVVADGRDSLVAQMADYFDSPMVPRSTVGDIIENGRFLVMRETAHWTDSDGKDREQSSLAIYEMEDGLIRRVSYYPAQK